MGGIVNYFYVFVWVRIQNYIIPLVIDKWLFVTTHQLVLFPRKGHLLADLQTDNSVLNFRKLPPIFCHSILPMRRNITTMSAFMLNVRRLAIALWLLGTRLTDFSVGLCLYRCETKASPCTWTYQICVCYSVPGISEGCTLPLEKKQYSKISPFVFGLLQE